MIFTNALVAKSLIFLFGLTKNHESVIPNINLLTLLKPSIFEYKQYFIALQETQLVTINENTYSINAVYLSPTTDILQYCKIDEEVSVNGNVCKISDGQFMTVSDVFVNTQKPVNTKDTKEE